MANADLTCKFKIPKDLHTKSPVFVADFSNGHINSKGMPSFDFRCYRHVEDGNIPSHARRILSTNNGRLNYSGKSFNEDSGKKELPLRYYVGVRNKSNGRIKVYDALIFHMKPVVTTKYRVHSDEEKNYKEKLDELTSCFGSKGKKRAMSARLKYSVDSSPLVNAAADIAVMDTSSHLVPTPNTSTTVEYIPPRNNEATNVYEIYNIRDIISTEEDVHLTNFAEKLVNDYSVDFVKLKNTDTYSKYVSSHLEDNSDIDKIKYLLYFNFLALFSKLKYTDIRKRDPAPDIPEPFKSKLMESFILTSLTEGGKISRTFPQKMKDKLLAYLLVLALFIDEYCVNISSLSSDLGVGLPKITNIAQALGCHVTHRKHQDCLSKFAELKLPLFVMQKYHKK